MQKNSEVKQSQSKLSLTVLKTMKQELHFETSSKKWIPKLSETQKSEMKEV